MVLIIAPLFLTGLLSWMQNSPLLLSGEWVGTSENYLRLLTPAALEILMTTSRLAVVNAFLCVSIGYACARWIVRQQKSRQYLYLFFFLAPYFVNSLVRLLALQIFVGTQGPLQGFLRFWDPEFLNLQWSHNLALMHLGLMLQYLPFAILPLYLTLKKWDPTQSEAAQDLGATPWQVFQQLEWSWMKPTVVASFFLIYIPSFGEYVVPEVLQGSISMVWGQYITEAFLKWRNWPLGAALGCVMMAMLLLFQLFFRKKGWDL